MRCTLLGHGPLRGAQALGLDRGPLSGSAGGRWPASPELRALDVGMLLSQTARRGQIVVLAASLRSQYVAFACNVLDGVGPDKPASGSIGSDLPAVGMSLGRVDLIFGLRVY